MNSVPVVFQRRDKRLKTLGALSIAGGWRGTVPTKRQALTTSRLGAVAVEGRGVWRSGTAMRSGKPHKDGEYLSSARAVLYCLGF